MNELVSIVMPTYNIEQYVGASIRSVLSQTYSNWELIVVDDCSTDCTVEVVRSFSDERIRLIENAENSGAAISRNTALRLAKGRWIAFLDGDDRWNPEKLERQLRFMTENGYSFSCTDYSVERDGVLLDHIITSPNVINRRKMYQYCYCSTTTVIYDQSVVGIVQIANLKKNNDYAMWLQIVEKSPCYRLPECLSCYVRHSGSISAESKIKLIRWHYILFRIGLQKSVPVSLVLTANNLFFGVLKKLFYKKKRTGNR